MSKYKLISKPKQINKLIGYCKQTRYCSFDFETTSLEYYSPGEFPMMMGVSFQIGSAWIIPLEHFESPFKGNKWLKYFKRFGKEVLENPDIVKIAWNLKFEYKWCKRYGIELKGRLFDGMLAKYLLDEEKPHDLKDVVGRVFPEYYGYETKLDKRLKWKDRPMSQLAPYCALDCDLTFRLMNYFEPRLIEKGFYNLFRNLLMMATRVLADSEYDGILIDRPYLEGLVSKYQRLISESEQKLRSHKFILKFVKKKREEHIRKLIKQTQLEIAEISTEDSNTKDRKIKFRQDKIQRILRGDLKGKKERYNGINFNSPQQMVELLFQSKHGLKFKPIKLTESGAPSTDEETLEHFKLRDKTGFIQQLLDHRGLSKLNSTYIEGILPLLDRYNRVHAGFKIHGTVTGRLSCAEPNLQNIPRGTTSQDIKKMFIAPKGYLLLEVDYSQAELRVVAELAKDKVMIDIFKRNYNIHVATACLINGGLHLYDKVKGILKDESHPDWLFWEKQKKRAKLVNFGILYGQTEKKLSRELECTEQEAAEFIQMWFDNYPQVAKWIKKQKKYCHKHGYVYSMWGRKRRLHNIYSEKYGVMLEAERQSVNCPIQSAASDYTLFSQVIIWEKIREGELPYMQQAYTVHDSIGYYVKVEDLHKVVPKIIEICANPQTMKYFGFEMKDVNMKVAVEVGKNWFDKHDYDPWANYKKLSREHDEYIEKMAA